MFVSFAVREPDPKPIPDPERTDPGGAGPEELAGHTEHAEHAEPPLLPRLFRLHHLMMRVGDRLTRRHGLSSSRWMLLCTLGRAQRPTTVGEVSDDLLLSAQNVSRMAAVLESEGLIDRSHPPGNGRSTFLGLTDRGRAAIALLDELGGPFVERMLEGLGPERIERLEDDLVRLIANASSYEAELVGGREHAAPDRTAHPRTDA